VVASAGGGRGVVDPARSFEELRDESARLVAETLRLLAEARLRIQSTPERPVRVPAPVDRRRARTRTLRRAVATVPAAAALVLLGISIGELSHGANENALSVGISGPPAQVTPAVTAPPVNSQQALPAVPPPPPLSVSVPRLGIKAPVVGEVQVQTAGPEVGLLGAPPNYHDLGWFRQSEAGLLVLDGHVGYRNDPGPLAFIGELKPGDEVVVATQSGQTDYAVEVVARAVKGQLPSQYFAPAFSADVMLITCDYTSPFSDGHFADNVYVVAQPG
jgi:hypothetical protein